MLKLAIYSEENHQTISTFTSKASSADTEHFILTAANFQEDIMEIRIPRVLKVSSLLLLLK